MTRRKKTSATSDTSPFIGMVRQYLSQEGIEQRDLAIRAEIGEEALSRLLSDSTRRPDPETVVGLARAMNKPVWSVATAAGYPFASPSVPSLDDERLLHLIQADPGIRKVLEEYYSETSPENRESLIRLALAILKHDPPKGSGQSSG